MALTVVRGIPFLDVYLAFMWGPSKTRWLDTTTSQTVAYRRTIDTSSLLGTMMYVLFTTRK